MKIQPKTEEEVARFPLLQAGEADFEVEKAEEQTSSKGNDMIKLTLHVWDAAGNDGRVWDYIMDAMAFKLRHFMYAVGLGHAYEAGEIDAGVLVGKSGRCIIRVKPADGQYEAKNEVADYIVAERTKETGNYEKSRSNGPGAVAADREKSRARIAFIGSIPDVEEKDREGAWQKACRERFPGKRPMDVTAAEWQAFAAWCRGVVDPIPAGSAIDDSEVPF